jgi:hypothetical protein
MIYAHDTITSLRVTTLVCLILYYKLTCYAPNLLTPRQAHVLLLHTGWFYCASSHVTITYYLILLHNAWYWITSAYYRYIPLDITISSGVTATYCLMPFACSLDTGTPVGAAYCLILLLYKLTPYGSHTIWLYRKVPCHCHTPHEITSSSLVTDTYHSILQQAHCYCCISLDTVQFQADALLLHTDR